MSHGGRLTTESVFADLITYLRRTNSRLVIPKHVLAEVSKEYAFNLCSLNDTTRAKWKSRGNLLISTPEQFRDANIKMEVSAMEEMLLAPASGVSSVLFELYQNISTEDVVLRGVHRIPPSNKHGEELRDVALWLIVLECAKTNEVAFITNDNHFKDGEQFHPSLLEEIHKLGLKVHCYFSISHFIAANALTIESAQAEEIAKVLARQEIAMLLSHYLSDKALEQGTIQHTTVSEVRFAHAEKYKVAEDSYFIQAKYDINAFVTVKDNYPNIFASSQYIMPKSLFDPPGQLNAIQKPSEPPAASIPVTYTYSFNDIIKTELFPVSEYLCSFTIGFSLRITGGKRDLLEIEKLELQETTRVSNARKPTEN